MKQWLRRMIDRALRLDEAAERENIHPALERQRLLISEVALQSRVADLKAEIERTMPDNPVLAGYKAFARTMRTAP